MKRIAILILLFAGSSAVAGEYHRGGHGHHHKHHKTHYKSSHHKHHSHRRHKRNRNIEHLVGGVVLGAVLHELVKPSRTQEAIIIDRSNSRYEPMPEFLWDEDGRCYSVERYENRKVLTEVPGAACSR